METLEINHEFERLIPPLADDEFKQLESNLLNEGFRKHEAITAWNGVIVDGHNRYKICQKHGIKFNVVDKEFKDKNEVLIWMIDNQLGKRNVLPYDRVRLNLKKEEILRPIAKEHQLAGKPLVNIDERLDTRKTIAKLSKVAEGTVHKVKFIEAKADDEVKKLLSKGEETINKVYLDLKRKEQREDKLELAKQVKDLPNKKYQIIYADPPWKYFAGGHHNQSWHYPTMDIEEIKALKVAEMADKDCILFLWVTFPMLQESFDVIKSWGFNYATCGFTWVKKNKGGEGWFFGLGNWTRSNAELCLIATKGHPLRFSANVSQVIDEPLTVHSAKPPIVRDKIVELCGDLPRVELFARQATPGWDVWGCEAPGQEAKSLTKSDTLPQLNSEIHA